MTRLERHFLPLLMLTTLLALALRLWGLTAQSLWLDEAISAELARLSPRDIVAAAAADVHPPGYYLLLRGWARLGDGPAMLRLLSTLCSTASVALLGIVGARLVGRPAALVAALLCALSEFQLEYAHEVRMYALLGCLSLVATGALLALDGPRWRRALLVYIVTGAALFYVHYHGAFVLLAHACVVSPTARRRFVAAGALIAVLCLPWAPILLRQLQAGGRHWIHDPVGPLLPLESLLVFAVGPALGLPGALREALDVLPRTPAVVLAAATCVLAGTLPLFWPRRARPLADWARIVPWVTLPLLLPWLLSQRSPVYEHKYVIAASYPWLLLLGALILRLPRLPAVAGLAILVLTSAVMQVRHRAHPELRKENWRDAVAQIDADAGPGDVVAFRFTGPLAPYSYYHRQALPQVALLPPSDTRFAALAGARRVWLFDYRSDLYDPSDQVGEGLMRRGFTPTRTFAFNAVPLRLWTHRDSRAPLGPPPAQ